MSMVLLTDKVHATLSKLSGKLQKNNPKKKITYSIIIEAAIKQFEKNGCKLD